jgi:hypothetical protein
MSDMSVPPQGRLWTITVPQQRWVAEAARRFGVSPTEVAVALIKHANQQTVELKKYLFRVPRCNNCGVGGLRGGLKIEQSLSLAPELFEWMTNVHEKCGHPTADKTLRIVLDYYMGKCQEDHALLSETLLCKPELEALKPAQRRAEALEAVNTVVPLRRADSLSVFSRALFRSRSLFLASPICIIAFKRASGCCGKRCLGATKTKASRRTPPEWPWSTSRRPPRRFRSRSSPPLSTSWTSHATATKRLLRRRGRRTIFRAPESRRPLPVPLLRPVQMLPLSPTPPLPPLRTWPLLRTTRRRSGTAGWHSSA